MIGVVLEEPDRMHGVVPLLVRLIDLRSPFLKGVRGIARTADEPTHHSHKARCPHTLREEANAFLARLVACPTCQSPK